MSVGCWFGIQPDVFLYRMPSWFIEILEDELSKQVTESKENGKPIHFMELHVARGINQALGSK